MAENQEQTRKFRKTDVHDTWTTEAADFEPVPQSRDLNEL